MSAAVSVVSCSSVGSVTAARRIGLASTRRLEHVADEPGVAEAAAARLGVDHLAQPRSRAVVEAVAGSCSPSRLEDRDQLVGRCSRGTSSVRAKRLFRPGLASMKLAHLVRVAGDDDGEIVAVVLHELDERVDRLAAEVVLAAARQRVRLVDQQHAAERRLEHRAWSCVAVWPT